MNPPCFKSNNKHETSNPSEAGQKIMKISFLSSGHLPFDDRIFYHLGKALADAGHNVRITSSKADLKSIVENITMDCFAGDDLKKKEKIIRFCDTLYGFRPELIICSEPLPLIAAKRYKKKHAAKSRILYDITEWYPSKKNLVPFHPLLRLGIFIKLIIFNIYATRCTDAFIFGEWYKSRPYRFLFPDKPCKLITYYPDLRYLRYNNATLTDGRLRLSFTGKINFEKGFGNFIRVVKELILMDKDLNIDIKVIGWYENLNDKSECEKLIQSVKGNVTFTFSERLPFITFWESITDTDIFIDLRSDSLENNLSLPIRLFYFAALGRPFIFTDLRAIRHEADMSNFGFLVKPDKTSQIAQIILNYIKDHQLYHNHCTNARRAAEELYNWQIIRPEFLKFIKEFSSY